jgi:hypothetical protein
MVVIQLPPSPHRIYLIEGIYDTYVTIYYS